MTAQDTNDIGRERRMDAILSDEQILACLSQAGDRQAMLQAAARMGMLRAAIICERIDREDETVWRTVDVA